VDRGRIAPLGLIWALAHSGRFCRRGALTLYLQAFQTAVATILRPTLPAGSGIRQQNLRWRIRELVTVVGLSNHCPLCNSHVSGFIPPSFISGRKTPQNYAPNKVD